MSNENTVQKARPIAECVDEKRDMMKRVRRFFFNLTSAASLSLFLVSAIFWIRGYWATDDFGFRDHNSIRHKLVLIDDRTVRDFSIQNGKGGIGVYIAFSRYLVDYFYEIPAAFAPGEQPPQNGLFHNKYTPANYPTTFENVVGFKGVVWGGFAVGTLDPGARQPALTPLWSDEVHNSSHRVYQHQFYLTVPIWFMMGLSFIWPTWLIWTHWRKRKPNRGLCQICGYDLRATPSLCPECGTVPNKLD